MENCGTPGRINRVLAAGLLAGVWLAAGLIAAGLVAWLARGGAKPDVKEPTGIMALGVLVLIATPVVRVAFALVAFALERDRLYAAMSAVVLGLLACGLVFGLVE
jgi:uncharacterized membrane protein